MDEPSRQNPEATNPPRSQLAKGVYGGQGGYSLTNQCIAARILSRDLYTLYTDAQQIECKYRTRVQLYNSTALKIVEFGPPLKSTLPLPFQTIHTAPSPRRGRLRILEEE